MMFKSIRFDPAGVHRKELPPGVNGIPSPGADNWAYDGCRFSAHINGKIHWIGLGDYLLYRESETEPCAVKSYLEIRNQE